MIELQPIGFVHSTRRAIVDDDWDNVVARIELVDDFAAEALDGIEEFASASLPSAPKTGRIVWGPRVEIRGRSGRALEVVGLDAVDGTPVLDIKPVMVEFLPRSPVRQPDWSRELMREYWQSKDKS